MIRQQDAHRESRKQAAASYSRYLGDMRLPAQSTAWYVGKTRLQWERVPPPRRRRRHRRRTRATKVSGTSGGRGTSAAWCLPACLTGALLPSACFLNPARHRDDAHGGYPVVRPQQLGRPWSSNKFPRAALHQTMPCHAPQPICTRAWFFFFCWEPVTARAEDGRWRFFFGFLIAVQIQRNTPLNPTAFSLLLTLSNRLTDRLAR